MTIASKVLQRLLTVMGTY